jgi:hypothetical protein
MTKNIRQIKTVGNLAVITLTLGYEAIIDASDVDAVKGFTWRAMVQRRSDGTIRAVYACRSENGKARYLHRLIAKAIHGMQVDHINGDGLDNRRENLRMATNAENSRNKRLGITNKSGLKGVCFNNATKRWRSAIMRDGKSYHLGLFKSADEASEAYRLASALHHGDFGRI